MEYFITATDTDAGKTFITAALCHAFSAQQYRAAALKPIASGADVYGKNEDIEVLRTLLQPALSVSDINNYCFDLPIAPHIAAQKEGLEFDFDLIKAHFEAFKKRYQVTLVEGVGGALVPLSGSQTIADLITFLNLPTIVVVNLKLGCINHAYLTFDALQKRNIKVAAWVANYAQEKEILVANEVLETLHSTLPAPCLGVVPHCESPLAATAFLDLKNLLRIK